MFETNKQCHFDFFFFDFPAEIVRTFTKVKFKTFFFSSSFNKKTNYYLLSNILQNQLKVIRFNKIQ